MAAYYRARAAEYDQWFFRQGRYDRGPELNAAWFSEVEIVRRALDRLHLTGDVLELAPGTGLWTERLVRTARSVTAVDASPEMLAIMRSRVAPGRVHEVVADLFAWQPDRQYDAVVFCFWLSHVPAARTDRFLEMVSGALGPGGRLFFADSRREPSSTASDHELPAGETEVLTRRLNDGRAFQIVKRFLEPEEVVEACGRAGLAVRVEVTPRYFLYGWGERLA